MLGFGLCGPFWVALCWLCWSGKYVAVGFPLGWHDGSSRVLCGVLRVGPLRVLCGVGCGAARMP